MKIPLATALGAGVLVWAAAQQSAPSIRGFSPEAADAQRAREQKARAIPDPVRLKRYLERMAAEPHAAGSPASKAVADYAVSQFREWGIDAQIEEFEALLPYPTERLVEMTAPVRFKAKLREPAIAEDRDSGDKGQLPLYNAYSGSGDVTGQLVYVNYGIPEDYEQLRKAGIDVKGKIAIARYGRSWRGTKGKVAQENGAAGCLIYSDPREDGFYQGDAYPKGPYRPAEAAQRGSVLDMPLYAGDPLTPGWASVKGSKKLAREEAATILRIPVLPISWAEAQPLLAQLGGAVVPEPWRGSLPLTYHYGPGPATVRMKLDFDWTVKPVYNVIATIPGSVFPDEWLIYGNHHDAWVNGANDPVSGAAALLETGRALAEIRKSGWQPKRTIKLALWDAEEFGLVGSTEWVEKHRDELAAKAVAYLNSDSNSKGTLGAGGSPLLQVFFNEVLRDVEDPATGRPLLTTARARTGAALTVSRTTGEASENTVREFELGPLGAGSDYVAFYHHTGIASLNTGFSGPGSSGVYHSIYDSLDWFNKFMDPDMRYGRALAQLMVTSLMRLADAEVLPIEFSVLPRVVAGYVESVRKLPGGSRVDFDALTAELAALRTAAQGFEDAYSAGAWRGAPRERLVEVNRVLLGSERALAPTPGLHGRPWYRHRLAAPGTYTGYSAKTLPTIREAVENGRIDEANREVAPVVAALRALRERVDEATRLLNSAPGSR